MNSNKIVQNVKRSSPSKDILPAWAEGEKLHGQKFFYHGMYISTLFCDNEHKDLQSSSKKNFTKNRANSKTDTEISLPPQRTMDLPTMLETLETNCEQFAFPDPGKTTQNVLEMNSNKTVQNVKRSSPNKDILPAWAEGEKLYGQKFFYHGMYISTLFSDNEHKELRSSSKKKQKSLNSADNEHKESQSSSKKKQKSTNSANSQADSLEISLPPQRTMNLLAMLETFETNRKQFAFPDPRKTTQNVLNSFSVISDGLHSLFPNGGIINKLSSSMGESDNIYLILGLYSLLCKLDLALEKQIVYSIKKLNCNIELPGKTFDIIESLIKETFITHNLNKLGSTSKLPHTQGTSNQTATKLALNLSEPSNQKSVASKLALNVSEPSNPNNDAGKPELNLGETSNPTNKTLWRTNKIQKKYFLNQHQMEFIDERRYVCYGCAGIFSTDPSCHIINPTHVNANYKPAS